MNQRRPVRVRDSHGTADPRPQPRIAPIDAYIDPPQPRARAIITHGHADHARSGHGAVLATPDTIAIMKVRYGEDCAGQFQALRVRQAAADRRRDRHALSRPAISWARRRCCSSIGGQRVVVTGDYKRLPDRTAQPFELVACDLFVTEATFGLPVFQHPDPLDEIARLLRSVAAFPERAHVIGCYALGKAQRVISLLREAGYDAPIYLHGAMIRLCELYEERGIPLGELRPSLEVPKAELAGQIVIAPPSAIKERWSRRLPDPVLAVASGWMSVKQRARQARRRTAAGDLRPCRLERAARRPSPTPGPRDLGDAWPRGCAGLLVPAAGAGGRAAQHRGLRGRRRRRSEE